MATLTCPHCGAPISEQAVVCMACGHAPRKSPTQSQFRPSSIVWIVVGFLLLMAVVLSAQSPIASLLLVLSAVSVALAGPLGRYRQRMRLPAGKLGAVGLSVLSVVLFFAAALAMPKTEQPVSQTSGILPTQTVVVAAVAPTTEPKSVPPTQAPATAVPKPTAAPPTPVPPVAVPPTAVPEPTAVPAPTVDPRRAAFPSYAQKLTTALNRSDQANKEHAAAAGNVPRSMTVVQFYSLTNQMAALNGTLAGEVVSTNVPTEARDFRDSVFAALKSREEMMNKAKDALDKPGVANQSAYEDAKKKADGTTLQAVGAMFKLCSSIGIALEDCNKESGLVQ